MLLYTTLSYCNTCNATWYKASKESLKIDTPIIEQKPSLQSISKYFKDWREKTCCHEHLES